MSFLPHVTSKQPWRHTHNASVDGIITALSSEPFTVAGAGAPDIDYLLLFERYAVSPSWAIDLRDGSLKRLRSNVTPETPAGPGTEETPNGIVVEVAQSRVLSADGVRKIVKLAHEAFQAGHVHPPKIGDLVFDPGAIRVSENAIGWLVAHGDASVNEDGSGEVREAWDIRPLSGATGKNGGPLRWENAEFVGLPHSLATRAREE